MQRIILSTIVLLGAAAGAAQAQSAAWPSTRNCTVSSPSVDGQPQLKLISTTTTDETGKLAARTVIQIVTNEVLSTDKATFNRVKLEVPTFLDRSDLRGSGAPSGSNYVLTLIFPDGEGQALRAIANGAELITTVPTEQGDKSLSMNLAGSGKAVGAFAACSR